MFVVFLSKRKACCVSFCEDLRCWFLVMNASISINHVSLLLKCVCVYSFIKAHCTSRMSKPEPFVL